MICLEREEKLKSVFCTSEIKALEPCDVYVVSCTQKKSMRKLADQLRFSCGKLSSQSVVGGCQVCLLRKPPKDLIGYVCGALVLTDISFYKIINTYRKLGFLWDWVGNIGTEIDLPILNLSFYLIRIEIWLVSGYLIQYVTFPPWDKALKLEHHLCLMVEIFVSIGLIIRNN